MLCTEPIRVGSKKFLAHTAVSSGRRQIPPPQKIVNLLTSLPPSLPPSGSRPWRHPCLHRRPLRVSLTVPGSRLCSNLPQPSRRPRGSPRNHRRLLLLPAGPPTCRHPRRRHQRCRAVVAVAAEWQGTPVPVVTVVTGRRWWKKGVESVSEVKS